MVNVVRQIDNFVTINRVLVSVSNKRGLDKLVPGLVKVNPEVRFYATGGTWKALSEILGADAVHYLTRISDYTEQPETQGGLVKTLDFKIYLGLLTERYNADHQADLARAGAQPIDMVVVNLYPFAATVARPDVTVEEARANVDIGGPTMIRAAAKNYLRVTPVVDPADYEALLEALRAHEGALDLTMRFAYARKAFAHTARYDAAISTYLAEQDPREVPEAYDFPEG